MIWFSLVHSCSLLLILFTLSRATDLQVDASLSSPNFPMYPSLSEALNALLTGQNLTEEINTITLLDSCLTVPQYFPGTKIGPVGTNGGTINIVYPIPASSAINTQDACANLPELVLANNSFIDLEYLTSFSISGINILFNGAENLNSIFAVETVTFSNLCFNNSELAPTLLAPKYNYFSMSTITTFSMTNGIYLFDEYKKLLISKTTQVTIDSFTIINRGPPIDGTLAAINISSEQSYLTNVNISNTLITCFLEQDLLYNGFANILSISNSDNVWISSLEMSDCSMKYPDRLNRPIQQQSIISVINTANFTMDNISVSDLNYGGERNQKFCYISAVHNTSFSNIRINDTKFFYPYSTTEASQMFYFADEVAGSHYPMHITLREFFIVSTSLMSNSKFFYFSFDSYENFGSMLLQNFTLNECEAKESSYFLYFQIHSPFTFSRDTVLKYITIDNFTLSNNQGEESTIAYFAYPASITKATESLRLHISNFNSSNNTIYTGPMLQVEGILTYIAHSQIANDNYYTKGYFYLSKQIVSTLLMENISVNNVTMWTDSALISSNNTSTRGLAFEDFYSDKSKREVFVETRPFIIWASTFTNSTIRSGSSLVYSNSPQITIQECSFSDLVVHTTSSIITLGNYVPFLPSGAYYFWSDYSGRTEPLWYNLLVPFQAVETSILGDYYDHYQAFSYSRFITDYGKSTNVFFITVTYNKFDGIDAIATNYIISIPNFQPAGGRVGVEGNEFNNVFSNDVVNLLGHTNTPFGYYAYNTLNEGNFRGYFFYFESVFLSRLDLSRNELTNSLNCGFYYFQADSCSIIVISSNVATNLQTTGAFIDMTCTRIYLVYLSSLTFEHISHSSLTGILASLNFISLISKEIADSDWVFPEISVSGCTFRNITLTNSQYLTHEIYQSSFLYIVTMVESLSFENMVFDSIVASPRGSIIISTSKSIEISNSGFLNLGFGNSYGAMLLALQKLQILSCTFENNYGLNSDGAGLIQIINSDPYNAVVDMYIEYSWFANNTAPYGTIMYIQDTSIELYIYGTVFKNNLITKSGGLIQLLNVSSSVITVDWTDVNQTQDYVEVFPQLKVLSLENTKNDVSIVFLDLIVDIEGCTYGVYLSIVSPQTVTAEVSNVLFFAKSLVNNSDILIPKFGFLQADNFEMTLKNFQAKNVSLDQTPVFIIRCDTFRKQNYKWSLSLQDSGFTGLVLSEALLLISSDEYLTAALDKLSVRIVETLFTNISWWSKSETSIIAGGITRSSTALIGRTTPSSDFTIVVESSTFSQLSGAGNLIFGTVESMFDSVLMISECEFTNLTTTGMGAVISPSMMKLTTFATQYGSNVSRNASYRIKLSSFRNIKGNQGCFMYWRSNVRGLSVTFEDSEITNVNCSHNGGIFYMLYDFKPNLTDLALNNQLTEEHELSISSRNVSYENITAQGGGILYVDAESLLLQISFEENRFEAITGHNGSVFLFTSSTDASNQAAESGSL